MKKRMFLLFILLVVILMYFSVEVYAFKELTRKEAEQLYFSAFRIKDKDKPNPVHLYVMVGKWGENPIGRALGGYMSTEEKNVYNKLQQLKLMKLRKTWKGELTYYESEVTEEGKDQLIQVEEREQFWIVFREKNTESYRWYKIKLLSYKFFGCTGIRNFKEKNQAIADFAFEFVDITNTFSAIAKDISEIPSQKNIGVKYVFIDLRPDWLAEAVQDPKKKVTATFTFDLYDDGWRLK